MMKIIFCIPRMNNGGSERVIANLANELSLNHEIRIVAFVGADSYYQLDGKVQFRPANLVLNRKSSISRKMCMLRQMVKAIFFLDKECRSFEPDAVISFLATADLLTFILHRKYRYFWVSSERCDPRRRKSIMQIFLKYIYKSVDLFICQSAYARDYYSAIPSAQKVIIPNPIGSSILGSLKEECIPFKIVSVGRLAEQKNFELLIKAFKKVKEELAIDMSLTIYGEGPQRKYLEMLIKSLKLDLVVKLPGSSKNVLEDIGNAALYVMSSDFEGFPNALLEAMAMGIPVIATDVSSGTVRELVTEQTGIIVPVNDEKKLADAMKRMIINKELRKTIRGKQASAIRNKYSQKIIAKRWEKAIEDGRKIF